MEENYIKFHQLAARLLEAPTVKIMRLVQESMAVWLLSVDEQRAHVWWRTYHMGEFGNVSNASAGYIGTNMASGIEVCWRTIRRDTVGTAGTNMGMSMEIFTPSLVKCIKDMSERHSDQLLCEKTGKYKFPSVPVIDPATWKAVQNFNVMRLQLAWMEHSAAGRLQWEHVTDLLCAPDGAEKIPYTDLVKKFHDKGHHVGIARTQLTGILIPTPQFLASLQKRKLFDTFEKVEEAVRPVQEQYNMLFNDTDNFLTKYPDMDAEKILDIMDSHVRRVQLIALFISAVRPLIYACLQNHAKFRQAWRLELPVHVSRLSPLSGMRRCYCSEHAV